MDLSMSTTDGSRTLVSAETIDRLRNDLAGSLVSRGVPGYDEARTVWNAMIDRRPGLIARCTSAADVAQAVRFAREHDLVVAVRGGGHNIAGNAVCDGGLVIDLSLMRSVRVDPVTRIARVGGGATLGDFDREAQRLSLIHI